jgi:hypothetical protein
VNYFGGLKDVVERRAITIARNQRAGDSGDLSWNVGTRR